LATSAAGKRLRANHHLNNQMNKFFMKFLAVAAISLGAIVTSFAQSNIEPAIVRDPVLETDAKHNLDVAWQAFKPLKRAYKQVIMRFEETQAAYPQFSKMDEFLYIAGMSSYYLSKNEGKQKVNLKNEKEKEKYAPEKLKQDANAYLSMLIETYPESKYRTDAEEGLKLLKTSN
jgi:outer membrane protein assembly factor BamD (BamD/ComL family)